ncbi:DUF6270 domain-containing protein [Glutamicibacter protophormiae]|uniref:DUF6270 domain-containing protein n=1 Tax=Glutamicibacter protophormiae TaxID=37930 RepID=UPI002A803596|nr:DUF6270 domain-containing protein [Glutamicibacter protophormiae]WPR65261.1 DUF6270 domain-containing protein [Glutamicibacter protophormiae]WPR68758.1 DUF6270 domain-containing protein [Glutamicibacter protophormiae]
MPNVFLYGGCVIRDAFRELSDEHQLVGYVARQSLISAINPAAKLPEARLDSAFQSRMVNGDVQSNLLHAIRRVAEKIDLLVMDCHIERFGVYRLPDATFVTPSPELQSSGILRGANATLVELGSDRHTGFWSVAARRFASRLESLGLKDKTLVIDAPWVSQDSEGTPFSGYRGRTVREVSDLVSVFPGMLGELGLQVERMPPEVASSPIDHRWGRAPFHFGQEAMDWVAGQMQSRLS